ncbi:MAG: MarR family transcriptional regulator, partial [Clostridia bacterium]|nr:MarR family transcriptional regulator [Clostridia bacterium]
MKTIEEEIVRMLGRLNALSKRGPTPPPPPPMEVHGGEPVPPPPPEAPRGQGRGRMLGLLLDHGEMSQTQIASHLGIRPQSLSEMLAKAESDGVIVRRQSTEDKRQTLVSLTDLGRSRVETYRENHRRQAAEFLTP